jgi:hypothetical protein
MVANGRGSVAPKSASYGKGAKVRITAIPDAGHKFNSWKGTGTGSYTGASPIHTITMNGVITEIATFT